MKTIRIILLVLMIMGLGALATKNIWVPKIVDRIMSEDKEWNVVPVEDIEEVSILQDGQYCFSRLQGATASSPYGVKEEVVLNITGNSVTGTKSGTQSGPDMTNGYSGTLTGARNGSSMELIYSYTVEGSENKEKEIYLIKEENIEKLRYPLEEEKGMLVPDKREDPQMQTYYPVICESR